LHFKLKRSTQLKLLMECYCAHHTAGSQPLQRNQVRFLYHGIECHDTQTPALLDMEEDDLIDCEYMGHIPDVAQLMHLKVKAQVSE